MLRSSHTPNWLQQLCVVPNVENRDAVIAATMEGDAKLWSLPVNKIVVYQVSKQHVVCVTVRQIPTLPYACV